MNKIIIALALFTSTLMAVPLYMRQQSQSLFSERLFPISCYGQAVEVCMRVLSDHKHQYDVETAADLCVGRLCRLASAVRQMECKHLTQQRYRQEDIAYIIGLMGIVYKQQAESLAVNTMACSLFSVIESRLALLMRCP